MPPNSPAPSSGEPSDEQAADLAASDPSSLVAPVEQARSSDGLERDGAVVFALRVALRVVRWLFWAVVVALAPLAIAWVWLPIADDSNRILEHGELGVLAIALAASAMDTTGGSGALGWWKGLLRISAGSLIAGVFVLLSTIFGKAPRLDPQQSELLIVWALCLSVAIGAAAVGGEVQRKRP